MPNPQNSFSRRLISSLYLQFCELDELKHSDRIAGWLRVHFLLQAYREVFQEPCPPLVLEGLWSGEVDLLAGRAPAVVPLLESFAVQNWCVLPRELLEELCAVYESDFFPDLGSLYLVTQSAEEIKRKGQVFTPQEAVTHAFDLLKRKIDGRILDLSCGAGEFLIVAYRMLRERYLARGSSLHTAHQRILLEHLYGVDVDPWAVVVTRCRLFLECPTATCLANHIHSVDATHIFDHPLGRLSYQLIVGNPPWGCKPKHNSFASFLEISIRLLAPDGQFSLLLPAAFLNACTYQSVRQWFLHNAEIDALEYAPAVFRRRYVPTVFLVGRRVVMPNLDHEMEVSYGATNWSYWKADASGKCTNLVPQRSFLSSAQTTFNIHYDPQMEDICAHMKQNAFTLQPDHLPPPQDEEHSVGLVKFVLGIITGNNSTFVRNVSECPDCEPLFSADDLEPFHLRKPSLYLVYDKHRFQQAASPHYYKSPEKLLYKFISKELCTAIDRSGTYTLNNLNCILPTKLPPHVSLRYISALLNSQLLNTYYMYNCFTGKVTANNLCSLPLKLPTPEEALEIETLVLAIESATNSADSSALPALLPNQLPHLLSTLNDTIYRLYSIPPASRSHLVRKHAQLRCFPFV